MLKLGGRLIGPVQESDTTQMYVLYERTAKASYSRTALLSVIYAKLQNLDAQER